MPGPGADVVTWPRDLTWPRDRALLLRVAPGRPLAGVREPLRRPVVPRVPWTPGVSPGITRVPRASDLGVTPELPRAPPHCAHTTHSGARGPGEGGESGGPTLGLGGAHRSLGGAHLGIGGAHRRLGGAQGGVVPGPAA